MKPSNAVEKIIKIEPEDLDTVRELAAAHDVSVQQLELRAIDTVTTATLALLGTSIAVSTVIFLVEKMKGGQIIDLRPDAPKMFYRSQDLLYGLIVIVGLDGKVMVNVKEPRGMFSDVVETLKSLTTDIGKGGVNAIAEAVKVAVDDKGDVSVASQLEDDQK